MQPGFGQQMGMQGPGIPAVPMQGAGVQGPGMQPQPQGQPGAPALGMKRPRRRVLTSLALQVFIFFGAWWDAFYYILNILVFVYKGVQLPYPSRNFGMEFSFAWLWVLIEVPRLFLASKGNKTERSAPLFFSFVLAAPLVAMYVYFAGFQTYVLKIDQLLNAIALVFMGIQFLLGIYCCIRFIMATRFA